MHFREMSWSVGVLQKFRKLLHTQLSQGGHGRLRVLPAPARVIDGAPLVVSNMENLAARIGQLSNAAPNQRVSRQRRAYSGAMVTSPAAYGLGDGLSLTRFNNDFGRKATEGLSSPSSNGPRQIETAL